MFLRAERQNLEGTALLVRSLFAEELRIARHGRDLTAAIIPARYDNGENDLLLGFEKEFRKIVKQLRAESPNSFSAGLDPDKSWELRVAYTPKHAYHERLCVGADDANPDLLEDYSALARFVAERALPRLEPSRREQLARESNELAALLPTPRRDPVSVKERLDRTFAELSREIQEHLPALLTRFVSIPNRRDLADLALVRQRLDEFSPEERQWIQTLERSGLLVSDVESEGESSEAHADALVNAPMGIRHVRFADSNALQEWPELRAWTHEAMPLIVGKFSYRLGHVKEAAEDFERAIAEAKKNTQNIPEAHYQLAIAKEALGDPTAAVAQYTRAIELDPALWTARYNRV